MAQAWRGKKVLSSGVERRSNARGQFNESKWKIAGNKFLGIALLVVGIALCLFGISLLVRSPQYAATTRIKIESDPVDGFSNAQSSYDPYFIQTTFEIIQSQLVLSNVVADLNLNEVWGKKYFDGKTLTTSETVKMIQNHLQLAPIRNTKLVSITFYSDDANEAAQVANAIAESYRNYRIKIYNQLTQEAQDELEKFQQQFQDEEKQILDYQTNVEMLRQKFGIQKDATNNNQAEQQNYWNEKRRLDMMLEQHYLLGEKIKFGKSDLQLPHPPFVEIIDPAIPPKNPVGPNRFLGVGLIIVGLFLMVAGWFSLSPTEK